MCGEFRSAMVKAILYGTNEQAFTILNTVAAIDHIPGGGQNFVPLNGFANFYNVSEKYLRGVLTRRGFIQKNYPKDVKRVCTIDLFRQGAVPLSPDKYYVVPGRDDLLCYRLADCYGTPCVSLPKRNSYLIYSPRMVLATALSLLFTDKSGGDNNAKRVAAAIKRSSYRLMEPERPLDPEPVRNTGTDGVRMTDSEVIISREMFDHMITTTVKSAVDRTVDRILRSPSSVDR